MAKTVTFTFSPDDGPAQEIEVSVPDQQQVKMLQRFAGGMYPHSFITLDYRIGGSDIRRGVFRAGRISDLRVAD